ncbi:Hpt domain-containing protein [Leptobacterium sp. I13]|uniref:Hpt domain-containing protein n=1 Tax=Leptobacterium meishanense TaxID=3128904 RepID=UPI0030EED9CB
MQEQPNLTYINKLSAGDQQFKKELIKIIKDEFPVEKAMYMENILNKKYSEAIQNVHKLKHKISILGLENGYKLAENYEESLKQSPSQDNLHKEFTALLNLMETFITKL